QVRLQVFGVEIEADVAIKLAILVIAGIALDRTPNLLRRFCIAAEHDHAALGTDDRSIDAIARPRMSEQDAVRVGEEIADAGVAEQFIDAFVVSAFSEPDALWPPAEVPLELARAELDLSPHGVAVAIHQWQKAVCRGAGNDLEFATFEE